MYELYKEQQNYPLALRYYEIYHTVRDTLLNEENIKRLTLLGAEYDFEKEKQQLEYELDTKIKRQRLIQYAIAAGLLVALVFIAILVVLITVSRFFLAFFLIVVLLGVCAHVGVFPGGGLVRFGLLVPHRQRWEDWPPAVPLLLPHVTATGPAL